MDSALERAMRYREAAARYRQMAQTEGDDDVRRRLLDLAEQYEDLANGLAQDSATATAPAARNIEDRRAAGRCDDYAVHSRRRSVPQPHSGRYCHGNESGATIDPRSRTSRGGDGGSPLSHRLGSEGPQSGSRDEVAL